MRLLIAVAGAGASAVRQAPRDPQPGASPQASTIAMDVNSWGRELSRWSIDSAGQGHYVRPEPNAFEAERIVTRSFYAGERGDAEIRTRLSGAERHAGIKLRCTVAVTDGPYGEVRWTKANGTASLAYRQGCSERAARDIVAAIEHADAQVRAWALAGEVVEAKPVEK